MGSGQHAAGIRPFPVLTRLPHLHPRAFRCSLRDDYYARQSATDTVPSDDRDHRVAMYLVVLTRLGVAPLVNILLVCAVHSVVDDKVMWLVTIVECCG